MEMNMKKIIKVLVISLVAILTLSACHREEITQARAVATESESMTFEAQAQTLTMPVYADGDWTVDCAEGWITVSPMSGRGNVDVEISVTANYVGEEMDSPRKGKVYFIGGPGAVSKGELTINQKGDTYKGVKVLKINEVSALDDEKVAKIEDVQVSALSSQGFVISDATGNLYVSGVREVGIGDKVSINGAKATINGLPAFIVDECSVTSSGTPSYGTPKDITADVDKYDAKTSEYVTVAGSNVNNVLRIAGAEKRVTILDPHESLKMDKVNTHKLVMKGYYAGVVDGNPAIVAVSYEDKGIDESLIPYPAIWAIGDGAKAAGVLNYDSDSFAAKNAIESIQGLGIISYIPATDASGKPICNDNDKYALDVSANNPRITGAWPGDYWLFRGLGQVKAGSKMRIVFEARVSATNPMYWQLEYHDGDKWKIAGDYNTTDETGETITYTHKMNADGSTNIQVDQTVSFNHNNEECQFRFRVMANWQANGQGPLAARNGGTARLSVTDTGEGGLDWWPHLYMVEEGDGQDRPDTDPIAANIIINANALAFEGTPDGPKTINVSSDYDFTVKADADWIAITPASGLAGEKTEITVTCQPSTLSKLRETKLIVYSADSKKELPVIQSAAGQELDPLISLAKNRDNVSAKAQTYKIDVQSTVEYLIKSDVEWISTEPLTKTVVNKEKVELYVAENLDAAERVGHIAFYNEEKGIESVLTLTQAGKPAVQAIFEDDFSWLAPFIAAYNTDNPSAPVGDTVGSDGKSSEAPNMYNTSPFNTAEFKAAISNKGYTDLNPSEKLMYAQDQYLKFSKTGGHNTAIMLDLAKYMTGTKDIDVSFDFSMMVQGDGTVDAGPVQVGIQGDGTFANGTKLSDPFTSVQEKGHFCWNKAKATIKGASANTKLVFMMGRVLKEDGSFNWAVSGAGRFFLDNILIVPAAKEVVFEDDFSWTEPFISSYNKTAAKAIGDTVGSDGKDSEAPNTYTAAGFDIEGFFAALGSKGYTDLNPGEHLVYIQDQYLKFSRTGGHNTAIMLDLGKYLKAQSDIDVSFDFSMMVQGDGTVDAGPIQVGIQGDGTFANGTKLSDPFTSVQETGHFCWNEAKASIKGASSNTKLVFMMGRILKEDGSFNWAVSGAGRFFLDNILITK